MKEIIIVLVAMAMIMPIASATCYDFEVTNVPVTRLLCYDNVTLEVTRNLSIGNDTCSYISNVTCDHGCNNFTNRCEMFKGEQENLGFIVAWVIIIVSMFVFGFIIKKAVGK